MHPLLVLAPLFGALFLARLACALLATLADDFHDSHKKW